MKKLTRKRERERRHLIITKTIKNLLKKGWACELAGFTKPGFANQPVTYNMAAYLECMHHRSVVAERPRLMAEHLKSSGWTQSDIDDTVWSRPNWQKRDGLCLRTLHQAYRIQLSLDSLAN